MWHEYILAGSVDEALQTLERWQGRARLIAGGSDLVIDAREGKVDPECVVDTTRIPEMESIVDDGDFVVAGGNVTFHSLWTAPLVQQAGAALAIAAHHVGAWSIQNVGTLAGNVVTAQPAGDGSIALVALGAEAEVARRDGRRWVAVSSLYAGPGQSRIDPTHEMIVRFRWRKPAPRQASAYERIARRESMALPIACCGVDLQLAEDLEHIAWVRIALGPVAETPFRATCAEDYLRGARCEEVDYAYAAEQAAFACTLRTSRLRATREYREEIVEVLVRRALHRAVDAARSGKPAAAASRMTWPHRWSAAAATPPVDGQIALTLNGQPMTLAVEPGATLATVLRDELGLIGTKVGCDEGDCGACTVLVDGQPVASCIFPAWKTHGRQVQTIEGVAQGEQLHPVQEALVYHDAVQCGYCTPGMVMSSLALLETTPDPTVQEVREGLGSNYCRCTGYKKIVEAVQDAAAVLRGEKDQVARRTLLRKDGVDRVTGHEVYAADMQREGLLHGKIVWSEHAHAEILSIDTTAAETVPGVVRVITHRDVPGQNLFGSMGYDQPALAEGRVLFVGEAVAVVYAETAAAAEEGAQQVRVDYRPLPGVFTPEQALAAGAPVLKGMDNTFHHTRVVKGDVEAGFAQAEIVVEDDYTTPAIEHAFLETESGLAEMDGDVVVVYQATQWPPGDRMQVADVLGLPQERVRIVQTPVGGAFGGKMDVTLQPLLALGAYLTGRPVKIVLERPESIRMHVKRHPFWLHYKLGATREGRIVAFQGRLVIDGGAYRSTTDDVLEQATVFASGPYEIPNVLVTGVAARTNNVPGGAMRGFGANQVCFAMESAIDELAHRLGADPFALRRQNMYDVGSTLVTGQTLRHSVGAKPVLDAAEAAFKRLRLPEAQPGKRIGVGVAAGMKNVGLGIGGDDSVHVSVELQDDGSLLLRHGAINLGQGSNTVVCQIAAQTMGLDYDLVHSLTGDTEVAQDGGITAASRQTYVTGRAALEVVRQFKTRVFDYAGSVYDVDPQRLKLLEDGSLVDLGDERLVGSLADLARVAGEAGESLSMAYHHQPQKTYRILTPEQRAEIGLSDEDYINYPALCYGCHVAIVEVDEETGHVQVRKVIAAHDVGVALIPAAIEGQIEGAVVMGLGYALEEEFVQEEGRIVSDTLHKLTLPRSTMPVEIVPLIVEDPDPGGPFGAKGLAEAGAVPTAPAVTNAIYDAVGVRVRNLPATRERVLLGRK